MPRRGRVGGVGFASIRIGFCRVAASLPQAVPALVSERPGCYPWFRTQFGSRRAARAAARRTDMKQVLMLITLACVATGAAAGDVYKWTDQDGVVHYSETQPPAPVKSELVHVATK